MPIKNSPGNIWFKNGDEYAFERALTYKRNALLLAKTGRGTMFGAYTTAYMEFSRWDSNDYPDPYAFLFNLDNQKVFNNNFKTSDVIETENTGSYRWLLFGTDFRNTGDDL